MKSRFSLVWTRGALRTFDELKKAAVGGVEKAKKKSGSSKQAGLFKQVVKCLSLLESNPRHPGLATHEFSSIEHPYEVGGKVFEAYAANRTPGAYRVFWCYGPERGQITVIAITPHP